MSSLSTWRRTGFRLAIGLAAVCTLLAGCRREQQLVLPKDDVVLAKIAGKPISQYDVDQLAARTLGQLGGEAVRRGAQGKLLEGLIQSRAIAAAAEKELSPLQKLALEREMAGFREQVLVRGYVDRHAPPAPVSPQMIEEYYKSHPERFGGKTRRMCEIVGATRDLSPEERSGVMKALQDAQRHTDWKAWVATLTKRQLPVSLTSTADDDQLLVARLGELIRSLKADAPSQVVLISGRPYVARATGEEKSPPRPLAEVRADIERLLSPAQLSSALEKVAQEARKQVEIEVMKGAEPALPRSATAGERAP